MSRKKLFWIGILGVLLFVLPAVVGGLITEGYDPFSHLISETYAIDTPYGPYLRFLGFVPSGILLLIFSWGCVQHFPNTFLIREGLRGLGIFYGLFTAITGLFPCEEGCSFEIIGTSISHQIHHLASLVIYIFVPICILIIGVGLRQKRVQRTLYRITISSGLLGMLLSTALLLNISARFVGLLQFLLEMTILVWIVYFAFYLRANTPVRPVPKKAYGRHASASGNS